MHRCWRNRAPDRVVGSPGRPTTRSVQGAPAERRCGSNGYFQQDGRVAELGNACRPLVDDGPLLVIVLNLGAMMARFDSPPSPSRVRQAKCSRNPK